MSAADEVRRLRAGAVGENFPVRPPDPWSWSVAPIVVRVAVVVFVAAVVVGLVVGVAR